VRARITGDELHSQVGSWVDDRHAEGGHGWPADRGGGPDPRSLEPLAAPHLHPSVERDPPHLPPSGSPSRQGFRRL